MGVATSALSRRGFLGLAGAVGAAAAASAACAVDRAYSFDPAGVGSLADIEHIVLLMQENRSFDHYFGSLSGVRGFDDRSPVFTQRGFRPGHGPDPSGELLPFHLDTRDRLLDADIINDPSHSWAIQHAAWHGGALDRWVTAHLRADGSRLGPTVMGYYTRADIPTHYALADAFTVCDHYFSSVLGPTAPNRLHWMTGTIDAAGHAGGPIISDAGGLPSGGLTWRTYPENLSEAGVSWKIYNALPPRSHAEVSGMMRLFKAYSNPDSELFARGRAPRFPHDFVEDVRAGTLPAVSWLIPPIARSEHPAYPTAVGAAAIVHVLRTLTAHPAVWEKTALIVSYDENGGLFDHVPPPVPSSGTAGEYVARTGPQRRLVHTSGPVGLGFRVPCLVISPYTRGGLLSSEVLDHTSQLRLIEARFGVPATGISAWRRGVTGDLTALFAGRRRPQPAVPEFPGVTAAAKQALAGDAATIREASHGHGRAYPLRRNVMPRQERLPVRARI